MGSKEPKLFEKIDPDSIVKSGSNGYWYCCTVNPEHPFGEKRKDRNKRYVYLHRAVLEKKLGRYLKPNEQADHKDGNKDNNEPENVQLKILGDHQQDHALNRGNHFWTKSPRNKKRASTSSILSVLKNYFNSL